MSNMLYSSNSSIYVGILKVISLFQEITKLKDSMTIECSSPLINGHTLYLSKTLSTFIQTGILK